MILCLAELWGEKNPLHPLKDSSQPACQPVRQSGCQQAATAEPQLPGSWKAQAAKERGGNRALTVCQRDTHSTARPAAYFHHIGLCAAARAGRGSSSKRKRQKGAFVTQHYVELHPRTGASLTANCREE